MQIKQGDSKAAAAPAIIKNTRHYAKCYHPLYGTSGAGSGAHSVQFVRVVGREGIAILCVWLTIKLYKLVGQKIAQ